MPHNLIQAILFNLDGGIIDTTEYHFLAWKRLADEEGVPFTRADNEALRGFSRTESLTRFLKNSAVTKDQASEILTRKNSYYYEFLTQITPTDLLPGVEKLLAEILSVGIKASLVYTDHNALDIISCLGISDQFDSLVNSGMVDRQKPAPDQFLFAAREIDIPPAACLVIEHTQAGVEAAHAAGMVAVGLGPQDRVGEAEMVFPDLDGVTLADLIYAATYRVSEPLFNPEKQHHRETILTLGNGYLSTRGTFEERFPGDRQATFIHGIWDDVPIGFTELANAPDWTALDIWIEGQRFDMSAGHIEDYTRYLNLRTGVLHRRLVWKLDYHPSNASSAGAIELDFERFASLANEHILAQRVRVTPLDGPAEIQVRAQLNSHVENEGRLHWELLTQHSSTGGADLVVRTRHTGKTLALSARVNAAINTALTNPHDCPGCPGVLLNAQVENGETLVFDKLCAVFSSRDTDSPLAAAQDQAGQAAQSGYEVLRQAQVKTWSEFWAQSDLIIEGDPEAQLALRHALFQMRIAAPTNDEYVSIGAKTLSGFGYRGHTFWDNEIFVLPFFTYTQPQIARNMLKYRYHCLPGARRKAAANGFAGAQFPWESAEMGDEVTPTWVPNFDDPTQLVRIWTGDIQIHISADIAYAMHQYWQVTGDDDFWRKTGIPVLLETAIFWGERAEPEGEHFAIRDVIGPDENHDHIDNNQFTNYMVEWHLKSALAALNWLETNDPNLKGQFVAELDLSFERLTHWQRVIDGLITFHNLDTGLIEQFEGFYKLKDVDWAAHAGRTHSMQEILSIEGCAEQKALKQADVIALLCLLGDQFDQATWKANWDYYVPITDHEFGSSLGPSMHAWAACRMGKPQEAYQHFIRAARADLLDVRGNAGDGIHAASAGGLWEAVVFGFAGMQLTENGPTFNPQFPVHWKRVAFNIFYRGEQLRVDFSPCAFSTEA